MEWETGCSVFNWSSSSSSNDWDLNAVVRYACGGRVPPPPSSDDDPFSSFLPPPPAVKDDELPDAPSPPLPDLPGSDDRAVIDDLLNGLLAPPATPPRQPQQEPPAATSEAAPAPQQQPAGAPPSTEMQYTGRGRQASKRSKKKKTPAKKVLERVPVDGMAAADPWAWRKYGQKPIKGTPHPRGYYRCSTVKECPARKMVERCRDDPARYVNITYTGGEHSHPIPATRNALAGTTRKVLLPAAAPAAAATEALSPVQSTSAGVSTSLRSTSMEYDQEEQFDGVEMAGGDAADLMAFLDSYDPAMEADAGSSSYMAVDGGAGMAAPRNVVVEETVHATPCVTALGNASGWR